MFLTDWLAMATQLFRGAKNIHFGKIIAYLNLQYERIFKFKNII